VLVMLGAAWMPCFDCRAPGDPDLALVKTMHACCRAGHEQGVAECAPGLRVASPTVAGPAGAGGAVAVFVPAPPAPAVTAPAAIRAGAPRALPFRRPPSYLLHASLLA
jgi:hypothetical protein